MLRSRRDACQLPVVRLGSRRHRWQLHAPLSGPVEPAAGAEQSRRVRLLLVQSPAQLAATHAQRRIQSSMRFAVRIDAPHVGPAVTHVGEHLRRFDGVNAVSDVALYRRVAVADLPPVGRGRAAAGRGKTRHLPVGHVRSLVAESQDTGVGGAGRKLVFRVLNSFDGRQGISFAFLADALPKRLNKLSVLLKLLQHLWVFISQVGLRCYCVLWSVECFN